MLKSIMKKLYKFGTSKSDVETYVVSNRGIDSFATVVTKRDKAFKIPLADGGIRILENIVENHKRLMKHGIEALPMEIVDGIGIMSKMLCPTVTEYIKSRVEVEDKIGVGEVIDNIFQNVKNSSVHVECLNPVFSMLDVN